MKIRYLTAATAVVLLASCETPMEMQATGGSRADGTVNLSYEYGLFQLPVVDRTAALQTARSRCTAWGYANAEPFGGQINHCNRYNGYGNCLDMLVTVQYQCTAGSGGASSQTSIASVEPISSPPPMAPPGAGNSIAARLGVAAS